MAIPRWIAFLAVVYFVKAATAAAKDGKFCNIYFLKDAVIAT